MLELQGKKPASKELIMEILSREYGWTPMDIKQLGITDVEVYLQIIKDRRKLENHGTKRT
jgi:hypothetical protein